MREIQEEYINLLSSLSDMAFFTDVNNNFVAVNGTVATKLEYSKDEFLSMQLQELLLPEYKDIFSQKRKELQKKKIVSFNAVFENKFGRNINVKISASLVDSLSGKLLVYLAHDVSEPQLMENEEKLEILLEDLQRISLKDKDFTSLEKEEKKLMDTIEKALRRYQRKIIENNLIVMKDFRVPLLTRYDEDRLIQVIWAIFDQIIPRCKNKIWVEGNKEDDKHVITFRYTGVPFSPEDFPNSTRITQIIDAHEGSFHITQASPEETHVTVVIP